jgi:hypothetical protein
MYIFIGLSVDFTIVLAVLFITNDRFGVLQLVRRTASDAMQNKSKKIFFNHYDEQKFCFFIDSYLFLEFRLYD